MNVPPVDAHCHLDLYVDHRRAFEMARSRQVDTLAVTTTPLAWEHNQRLVAGAANIQVALGIHPQLVGQPLADITAFAQALGNCRFVGEVGLDAGPKHYGTFDQQCAVFKKVLQLCAAQPGKVLSVHCVRAFKETFALLDTCWSPKKDVFIFHWFSGGLADARKAIERGCFFSINPQMTRKENVLGLLREIPIERILSETDGPFTAGSAGSPRWPGDVEGAVGLVAEAKNLSSAQVSEAIWANWLRIKQRGEQAKRSALLATRPVTQQTTLGL